LLKGLLYPTSSLVIASPIAFSTWAKICFSILVTSVSYNNSLLGATCWVVALLSGCAVSFVIIVSIVFNSQAAKLRVMVQAVRLPIPSHH
jgi:hypothetical protein